jgi:hypothetical protein
MEMKDKEKGELLEKLTLQQKKVDESEEKAHKLEADILMMRRALEQSLTRLNRMSSDSDYYVDRFVLNGCNSVSQADMLQTCRDLIHSTHI